MAVQRGEPKSAGRARSERRYQLETVARACLVLRAFATDEEVLGLADIARRTGFEKTIVFRIIRTLEHEGLLRKVEDRRYATNVRLLRPKRFRIGYASQTSNSPFSMAIEQSLRRAASKSEVDLIVFDNHYSGKIALRRARQMIEERVDLAIEFQTHDSVAPLVSDMFHAAKIPLIAVEIPHPGAVFYGVDNYNAGVIAGRALAKWVKRAWEGRADELLLLELKMAGSIPLLRLKGVEAVVNEAVPGIRVIRMDTRGEFARALAGVRKRLQSAPAVKTLIAGVNDPCVLGALRAFEESGRLPLCAAVGLGAIPEARQELRRPGTKLIGSVAFFPERYGKDLVALALDILHKRHAPSAVFAGHQLLTRDNVDSLYPNDGVMTDGYPEIR